MSFKQFPHYVNQDLISSFSEYSVCIYILRRLSAAHAPGVQDAAAASEGAETWRLELDCAWSSIPHPLKVHRGGEDVHIVCRAGGETRMFVLIYIYINLHIYLCFILYFHLHCILFTFVRPRIMCCTSPLHSCGQAVLHTYTNTRARTHPAPPCARCLGYLTYAYICAPTVYLICVRTHAHAHTYLHTSAYTHSHTHTHTHTMYAQV